MGLTEQIVSNLANERKLDCKSVKEYVHLRYNVISNDGDLLFFTSSNLLPTKFDGLNSVFRSPC